MVGKGTLVDLSPTGCGVKSTTLLRKGVHLALSVTVPEQKTPMEIPLATVRWALGSKFGLEFIRIGVKDQARISRMVKTAF